MFCTQLSHDCGAIHAHLTPELAFLLQLQPLLSDLVGDVPTITSSLIVTESVTHAVAQRDKCSACTNDCLTVWDAQTRKSPDALVP
jgi:hypothetical protein